MDTTNLLPYEYRHCADCGEADSRERYDAHNQLRTVIQGAARTHVGVVRLCAWCEGARELS